MGRVLPERRLDPDQMRAWRAILASIGAEKPGVASVFEHGVPLTVGPGRIVIAYAAGSFLLQQATAKDAQAILERVAADHFGVPTTLAVDESDKHANVLTVAQENARASEARIQAARKRVEDHPLVTAAISILGAELRDVRLPNDLT